MTTIGELLKKTKIFLLDMDGTVYFDDTPIGEMQTTLRLLRRAGKKLVYCTNNSSKTSGEYREKLKRIGLWENGDMVYTSAMATIEYLKRQHAGKSAYVLAREEVKSEFEAAGIPLTEEKPDVCVLAYDTALTFEKLKKFNEFLVRGSFYAATHPDTVCPALPVSAPDVGSFIELLKCSSGRTPDVVCGKPYEVMGDALSGVLHAEKSEIAIVGDRLHTDIRFANNNGFTAVLVLSGETDADMVPASSDTPDLILNSLNDLTDYL